MVVLLPVYLRPFIRREFEMTGPLRLSLHRDLYEHFGRQEPSFPIDFCYVRLCHVGAINRMAQTFFWPGIDISESLAYPDFSCVAMYRKLVIGFAFLVPNLSHTEAYISFLFTHPDWRRGGIAKFMLYHLIQVCRYFTRTKRSIDGSSNSFLDLWREGYHPARVGEQPSCPVVPKVWV